MTESNNTLRDLIDKIANERGYVNGRVDVQDVSSEGSNYSSTLHEVTISAPPREDLKLFAKVACIAEEMRATDDNFGKAYETERVFYSEIAVAFERLYSKHEVKINDRMNIPKYYGHESTNNKDILVLENLAASGFDSFDRFKPFDWDYASTVVAELAKFHALGITAKAENLQELDTIRKIGYNPFSFRNMKEVFMEQAVRMGRGTIKEEYRARAQKYLNEENMEHDLAILWKPLDEGFLIHGDYRGSNLMHQTKNGKVNAVPLDFQTLRFGPLVTDLLYFIWCGSDSEFRQNHFQQLLDHYYSELTNALKNLHVNINDVYPRKTYDLDLEDAKTLRLMLGLGMMPILMVDPDDAPEFGQMEDMALEPNKRALDRMNGVVADYIRWGII